MKNPVDKLNQAIDWQWLNEMSEWVIEQAIAIQQIPAPTFHEAQRAAHVAAQFAALGLTNIQTDALYNVYGLRSGQNPNLPAIMLCAHIDTVFPQDSDLTVQREDEIIHGPGLGDNSVGVAGMLGTARALALSHMPTPECDVWFVATTREEGLGDLGGMKMAFERLRGRIGCVINLEGLAFGHVYHAGIAVRRLRITASAPGGHSWLHFGRESAIHGLVNLGTMITALQPPQQPRTTYNIGIIEGGHSINSIATEASLWLDLRSEDRAALAALEQTVRGQVQMMAKGELKFTIEVVGDRPAGAISTDHPLVQYALAALKQTGVQGSLETGSTDANIPLSVGCPAVTVGITRGGNAHRLDEYIETRTITLGLRQVLLLLLTSAHQQGHMKL